MLKTGTRIKDGLSFLLCAGVLLAPLAAAARGEEPATRAPAQKASRPGPHAVPSREAVEKERAVNAAKALLEKHLQQYIEQTDGMLRSRIEGLKGFFEERKEGAPLYASAVLDLSAKGRMAGSLLESFFTQAGQALGVASNTGAGNGTDSFTAFARRSFRANVLDPDKAKGELERTVAAFRDDMAEAEARLLVALGIDIPDDAIERGRSSPDLRAELAALQLCDAVAGDGVDDATSDFGTSLGMFVVSNILGNEVAKMATPEDASRARKFGTNIVTGVAVDAALDRGVKALGYDPEAAVVARTKAGIDRIRSAVIDGDPALGQVYPTLSYYRRMHPDSAVRQACQRADEGVERGANLGLNARLQRVRNERFRGLWKALMTHIAGPEAASSPFLMYGVLDASQCSPADQVIRWADSLVTKYAATR